jgi:D-beta-D-heptose 7-phosphate kinase/D-beta-D-heptose 1-phosphate adenosyltransferase
VLIDDVQGARILVIGDLMLDHFVTGIVERVSPEAPALVVRVDDERSMLGGAGNVAANIASLGGVAVVAGVMGNDPAAAQVSKLIAAFDGAVVDAIVRSGASRTTQKTRFIAGDRHLLRADYETEDLTPEDENLLVKAIEQHAAACDAVVVSDYSKGVVSSAVMSAALRAGKDRGIPVIADPKRRDFRRYAGAALITPNRKELEFATGELCQDMASCERAAREVTALTGAAVLLTLSEDGVALFEDGRDVWVEGGQTTVVRDVSGAGDTILAASAVALAAGASLLDASHFANVAAAVAVGKSGTSCVTSDELNLALLHAPDANALMGKLVSKASAATIREVWRNQGLAVGFTNGCFDLLHPGHIKLLAEARATCDRLIVGLNTDDSVRRVKGETRPIQTELARAEVIGALRSVDVVVLFDGDTPLELIHELRPDVLIKGADYTVETVVGADVVIRCGGRVALIDLVPGQSSSRLIATSRDDER